MLNLFCSLHVVPTSPPDWRGTGKVAGEINLELIKAFSDYFH